MYGRMSSTRKAVLRIVLVGLCAASIECGKLVLAAIPNVEVVTLLTALYGYVFGGLGIVASVVFVCIEPCIYGVGSWVLSYFIYWPLVATVFMLLGKIKLQNRWLLTLTAVTLTVFFGFLTTVVDVGLFMGRFDSFWKRFSIIYLRGIPFYVAQIVTNLVVFPTLFTPLRIFLQKSVGRALKT